MPLMALKGPNQNNPWSREARPWGKVAKNGGPDGAELYCNLFRHRLSAADGPERAKSEEPMVERNETMG